MPYTKTIREVVREYHSDMQLGLRQADALALEKSSGKNELIQKKKETIFHMFFQQFHDPMVLILLAAVAISFFLKEFMDASIIFVVILLNAMIGVVQEYKAEKAIDALEKMSTPKAYVIRDGVLRHIDSKHLVAGDIVELEAGCYIPADMRLLSSSALKVDESALTGESEAQLKDASLIYHEKHMIADQKNMVFMSTYVTYGKGRGIVVRCGMDSEVGNIARMLDEENRDPTPLEKRLAHLSKLLGILSVGICALMFLVAILQGRNLFDMLLVSISLAVAAIPEGLPAVVTIVLAFGVQVMSKHNAIIRKMHAVETLGSVSVICSDKTGTLTQNKMHVVSCYSDGCMDHKNEELLRGFTLCNDALWQSDEVMGEATETALLTFCEEEGVHQQQENQHFVRVKDIPFDSTRKKMTTIHAYQNGYLSYTKGALESLLDDCSSVWIHGRAMRMTAFEKQRILQAAQNISEDAQRVLGLARKQSSDIKNLENDMCFVGFAGLMDPPRVEVKDAIALCHQAGIAVVMITGDHPTTAYAIARELGIAKHKEEVLNGKQLDEMSDEMLEKNIDQYRVYARVTPLHKVRIVQAFKKRQRVVAMSGDGVNDAPSLKQADIGIAMGKNGTDVCKQASDMVLADDNFASIVTAVEQGRNIYLNIQKAILYLLSCNLGEIMALFLAIICMPQVTTTLRASQLLWVNLITDAFPALALGMDPKDDFIMKEKPRDPKESLFAHGGLMYTILNGMFIGTITLVAFRYGLFTSQKKAQTMAFMVLSLSQLFHSLNLRSIHHSIFEVGIFKNHWLILTFIGGVMIQVAVCELPIFQLFLHTMSLDHISWVIVFGLSSSVILINEISKMFGDH